jgi:hypothetical protein
MSLTKVQSTSWPYAYMPLTSYNQGDYKDYQNTYRKIGSQDTDADIPCFYSIDWFLPTDTTTQAGGYQASNGGGTINEIKAGSENYSYYQAPRDSTYTVNIDIPIKVKARNAETPGERGQEKGPSIVKIIAILEVRREFDATWSYLDFSVNPNNPVPFGYTTFNATNIPIPNGGRQATGTTRAMVDEKNSFLYFSADTVGGTYNGRSISPFFEGRCQLFNKEVKLNQNDRIRVKLYFAEVTTFFRRSDNIYFEVATGDSSKNYFEVFDTNTADITLVTTKTIGQSPAVFSPDPDNQTLTFSDEMSLLYNDAIFEPQDVSNPQSVANLYSPVEYTFTFQKYDIIRFTPFYAIKPDYYYITEVLDPVFANIGTTKSVISPLKIRLNKTFNPNLAQGTSFAIFRKIPDETCIMLDFKKREGLPSNALILPHNLEGTINKSIGDIIGPLKDTVLSKVLVIA